ncbi:hypothetical protein JOE11_000688 [Robbsia andropogonis]
MKLGGPAIRMKIVETEAVINGSAIFHANTPLQNWVACGGAVLYRAVTGLMHFWPAPTESA